MFCVCDAIMRHGKGYGTFCHNKHDREAWLGLRPGKVTAINYWDEPTATCPGNRSVASIISGSMTCV